MSNVGYHKLIDELSADTAACRDGELKSILQHIRDRAVPRDAIPMDLSDHRASPAEQQRTADLLIHPAIKVCLKRRI